jgi:hypothetical protein
MAKFRVRLEDDSQFWTVQRKKLLYWHDFHTGFLTRKEAEEFKRGCELAEGK